MDRLRGLDGTEVGISQGRFTERYDGSDGLKVSAGSYILTVGVEGKQVDYTPRQARQLLLALNEIYPQVLSIPPGGIDETG